MESLILSILGDIIGFEYKKHIQYTTKKKDGDSFVTKGLIYTNIGYYKFIYEGGVTKYYGNYPFSFPTVVLFSTMK